MSKINRDKCLEIWGSKTYLEINAWTPGYEPRDADGCRNIGDFGMFWGGSPKNLFAVLAV